MELRKIVTLLSVVALNATTPLQVNAAESTTDSTNSEISSNQEVLQKVADSSDFSQISSDLGAAESSTQNSTQIDESDENVIEDSQQSDENISNDTSSNDLSNSSEDNNNSEINEKSSTSDKSINKNNRDVAQEAAPVTVKCVTDDGIVITTKTLTGNIGDSYTATHVSHYYGWVLNERPDNYNGKFTSDPQTVTLVYSSAPVKRFDVKYIDLDSGKEISDSTPIYGIADAPYTTKAKNIDGYTLVKDSGNTSGTLPALYPYNGSSGSAGTIVYYYQGNGTAEPITVNYVDQDGHQLAESDTLTGQIGANYESSSKNIDGWALKEMPENSVGKFSNKKQTISYVYEKADSSPVTVKFVDTTGQSIYDDIVLNGKKGNTYTTSPIIEKADQNIRPKWMLKAIPENATGKFSDTPQTVTYVYGKAVEIFPWIKNAKDNNATINFGPAQYVVEGEEYSVTLPEKPGWRFVGSDVPLTGIAEKDIDIELYYEMYTPVVTVKYTDKDGNELAKEENIEGKYGFPYETSEKNIEGWTLKETPLNAKGVLDQETQTVTYVYEKATAAPVTVKYVDKDGNELATPDTLNGNIGDSYTTEAKEIAGWTAIETPTNATGTFGKEAQTVTYVYEKATAAPVTVKYVDKDGNELATPDTLNGNIGD
ncbi:MucBP domain-containing protein, partial [Enterococcus faecalis]|nr:MucBP domain-containing protein [Enterococcus faecalis]